MAGKHKAVITFTIIIFSFLTGCWDAKRLEDLNLPIAAGYEVVRKPDSNSNQMEVYAVIPVFYKTAPKNYIIDITKGELTGETRTLRKQHLSEELSLGSFQVAIFGSAMAKEGVCSAMNIITRTPQMKGTVTIAVADGNIEDIFKFEPVNYPNVGIYLERLLDNAFKDSFVPKSDVHQFSVALASTGWHAVAPMLKIEDNKIVISKYAIFENDKIAHAITLQDARILSVLSGKPSLGMWTYDMIDENDIPYTVSVNMKNKTKVKIDKDNKGYHFQITVNARGRISEIVPNQNLESIEMPLTGKNNLLKSKTLLKNVEKGYEKYMKNRVDELVYKAQNEFRMDIFNWIKFAQAKWRSEVDSIDWDEAFSNADITVEVNAGIEYTGEGT